MKGNFVTNKKVEVLFGVYGLKRRLKHYVAEVFKIRRTKKNIL